MKKDQYHFREGHKPFKTKDGYTVYTLHIVSGPPPPKAVNYSAKGGTGRSRVSQIPGTTGSHHVSFLHHGWLLLDDMWGR